MKKLTKDLMVKTRTILGFLVLLLFVVEARTQTFGESINIDGWQEFTSEDFGTENPSGSYQYWGMDGDYETYYKEDLVGTDYYGNGVYKSYWIQVVPAQDGGVQRVDLNSGSGSLNASWNPNTGWQVDYIIPSLTSPATYTAPETSSVIGANGVAISNGTLTLANTTSNTEVQSSAVELNKGLLFENGQWVVDPQ